MKGNVISLHWIGSIFENNSLSIMNRNILKHLIKYPNLKLIIDDSKFKRDDNIKNDFSFLDQYLIDNNSVEHNFDISINNQWPPNLNASKANYSVIIQPWEFGSMPSNWYEPFITLFDDVWAISEFNRNVFVSDGIPKEKTFVATLGLDTEIYRNQIGKLDLNTNKKFKFLFNGATVFRKGIDLLVEAFTSEFDADEDVCLVIKDISEKHRDMYEKPDLYFDRILLEQSNLNNPEILYLPFDYSKIEIIKLYNSCDCYVHPYRGEGFGLPILEAMAIGLPSIIPNYGSALDFCNSETSYFVDYKLVNSESNHFTVPKSFYYKSIVDKNILNNLSNIKINKLETVSVPNYVEVDILSLRKNMRLAFENKSLLNEKSEKAKDFVLENFDWEKSAEIIYNRLIYLFNQNPLKSNHRYFSNLYREKGKIMSDKKLENEAIKYFNASILLDQSDDNYFELGLFEYKRKNYSASLKNLTKSYSLGRKDKKGYKLIYDCLEKTGNIKVAEQIKEKYL